MASPTQPNQGINSGIGPDGELDLVNFDPFSVGETPPHLQQVLDLNKKFREMFIEYLEFVQAHPKPAELTTPTQIKADRKIVIEIERKRRTVIAQVSLVKTAYRIAVLKTREDKEKTAKAKNEMDALVLQFHNLKYEQESLQKEIYAAENFDHKYTKLPLIPVEEFLAKFPEYKDKSEAELMEARIEHEHKDRVALEEERQEKLKKKQQLIAEVKRRKENLDKLDQRLENFIDAAKPIEETLANETFPYYEKLRPKSKKFRNKMLKKKKIDEQAQQRKDGEGKAADEDISAVNAFMNTIAEDQDHAPVLEERLVRFLEENLTETSEDWRKRVAGIVTGIISLENGVHVK